jgi:hypothetical protein
MASDPGVHSVEWRSDPALTHVVSVGISRYDIGGNFTLPRAAEHALQFAEWARYSGGVKAENIHLFLSDGNPGAFDDRLKKARIDRRPATSQEINGFIEKQLKNYSGDLLYLFWSGHGSISENRERILFFEDLTADFDRALDLNHLLVRLRSEPHGKFRLQLAYVDACANRFEELRFKISAGKDRPGVGKLVTSVRQVFFLAADSGREAMAGEFSSAVLGALKGEWERGRLWPPDPDAVREAVRPIFEQMHQRPVQIAWSTKDGDEYGEEVSGDLPASDYVNGVARAAGYPVRFLRRLVVLAPALTAESSGGKRDELYRQLSQQPAEADRASRLTPEMDLLRLIARAFESRRTDVLERVIDDVAFTAELGRLSLLREARVRLMALATTMAELRKDYLATVIPLAAAPERLSAATVDAMLDELTQIHSDDSFRFLWQFLLRVAARHPAAGAGIEQFVGQNSNQVVLRSIQEDLQQEQRFLLSITIEPEFGEHPLPRGVEARLLLARTVTVVHAFPAQKVEDWSGAERAAGEVVLAARKIVIDQYRKGEDALDIEFLLPEGSFSRAPDQFGLALRPKRATLGRVHSVIVRWRARVLEPSTTELGPWYAAAQRIDRKASGKVEWLDVRPNDADRVCTTCRGLLALGFLPEDEIEELIGAGFPFIAWLRSPPADGWAAFKQRFERWAGGDAFELLPRRLRAIRQAPTDLGASLTMFWDDPEYARHWMPLQEPKV